MCICLLIAEGEDFHSYRKGTVCVYVWRCSIVRRAFLLASADSALRRSAEDRGCCGIPLAAWECVRCVFVYVCLRV